MHKSATTTTEVLIAAGSINLQGDLSLPRRATGIVIFAHGSGSSRFSSRNQTVAQVINDENLGILLFDLLTPEEEVEEEVIDARTHQLRFDIPLLAQRLVDATRWVKSQPELKDLKVGYFGASTGGAAALVAAAELGDTVTAVVSRGGRPDLAGAALTRVQAPTLLIVGGRDEEVLRLNEEALEKLNCQKELAIIPGATHLFEEPGTLEAVAQRAAHWFKYYLQP